MSLSTLPVVGHKVLVWNPTTDSVWDPNQGFEATIVFVAGPTEVNVAGHCHDGSSFVFLNVTMQDASGHDEHGAAGMSATYATPAP